MEDLKIRLVLEGADQVQAGANRAADGVKKLGQAGQQAGQQVQLSGYQMQQVSAQLQDLFVQIQGGQAPLTAILQQGSQLSAVFGGVGNALKAVSSLITPTALVLGTVAAAVGAVAVSYVQAEAEANAFGRALILTGGAADVTVGQLQAMARAQSQIVGTQAQASEALAALAATGKVSAASLGAAAEAATRLARVGAPIEDTAKKFAQLGKEPLKALIEFNDAENFLTTSVYKQVKALQDQGRTAEAAAVAIQAYAAAGIDRSKQLEGQLGKVEKAWKSVGEAAKTAWDRIVNLQREDGPEVALAKVEERIRAAQDKIAQARSGELAKNRPFLDTERIAAAQERELANLREQATALEETIRLGERSADAKARAEAETKKVIKADEDAAEAAKKLAAERERDAAALERAIGLSGSYQKDLAELAKLRDRGVLTEQQYVKAVGDLITAQPIVRQQLEQQAVAHKAAAKALEDLLEAEQRRIDAIYKGADQVALHVRKLLEEEQAIALSVTANMSLAEAIERVTIARVEEAHAKATAANDMSTAAALRAEIEQREKLATLINRKEVRDAGKRSAEEAAREWKRTTDEIERSLTDALLRGFESGKGFAVNLRDTLVNLFKTLVLRPIIQPIASSAAGGLASLLGLPGNASASTASSLIGGGSSLGGLGSLLNLGGLNSAFGGGWQLAMNGGTGLALEGAGSLIANGGWMQGLAQGAGALGPLAALASLGYFGGKAISNGYAIGGSANVSGGLGAALGVGGAAFYGPLGAAVGGLLGGAINRAFGMKAKEVGEQGIEGTATMSGFAGDAYAKWTQKGGWFRSDKSGTDRSAISTEQDAVLDAGIQALYKSTAEYAKVLGLPLESINGYAASFKVAWGKTDEENQKAIQTAMIGLGDQLAARYATQLAPLQKAGETLAATLSRLSTLQVFSNTLNSLGGVFSKIAGASVTAREHLIELAGGMDALGQQALGFAQNYYNRDEIAGMKAKDVQAALSSAGITADLGSREQFRALVESLDPSTDTGAKQLAALLSLQGSFATVADYLTESGLTLNQAAALAPASDLLSPLLSTTSQQLQLAQQSMDAQIQTRDATLQMVGVLQRLTSAILGSGGAAAPTVPGYRQPEVTLAP